MTLTIRRTRPRGHPAGNGAEVVHLLDRLVRNVEHGRFERALSALTAAAAVVTGTEIFLEHDSASFSNRMMWVPIALTPLVTAAGIGGVFSKRIAKTALPAVSAVVVANGLQGTYLHMRGIGERPGGWRLPRYNIEMGPPLLAPLLFTMVGGMGILAAILRREARG
ncbi:MAG TPA: hypothetical protein VFA11_00720 [Acidimicrobiales bacterium]|nr:hypothetical protein [Acidimicrobiales bacterium]